MKDRRRRGIAFENLAKEMQRYLEDSEDAKVCIIELQEPLDIFEKYVFPFGKWPSTEKVKVGIVELQERLEVPVQIGITLQQVAQQARNERNQKVFPSFGKKKKRYV